MDTWNLSELTLEPHAPRVLRTDDETRSIALRLPAGEELQEHQVHERAYVIVLDGEVTIDGGAGEVRGGTGVVAHFDPNERHTVRAQSDATLLLLLSPWPGEGHPSQP